jgi:hypothetical protein
LHPLEHAAGVLEEAFHIVTGDAAQLASPNEVQLSVGIDLAAQNKNTAACVIEWHAGSATAQAPLSGPLVTASPLRAWWKEILREARIAEAGPS